MFLFLSKIFFYLTLLTPLIISRRMFFPFVAGKAIYFRVIVELSLLFYLLYFLFELRKNKVEEKINNKPKLFFLSNPVFISVLFFIFVIFLVTLTGVNPKNSFFSNFERDSGALQLLHYFIFFYLALSLLKTKKDWINFIRAFLLISLYISFYVLGQVYSSSNFFVGHSNRPGGTLGNPIYLANYLLFVYFFAFYLIFNEKNRLWKWFWEFYVFFQGIIFLFACTRSTTMGMILAIFAFSFFKIFELRKKKFKNFFPYLLIVILIPVLGAVFYSTQESYFWHKIPCICRFATTPKKILDQKTNLTPIERTMEYRAPHITSRLFTWSSALGGFMEKPILGWGPENFPYLFDKYYSAKHANPWYDRAHNLYLDYLTNGGLVLFLSFFAIIFAIIYQLNKVSENKVSSNVKFLSYSLLIAYLTQAFFNFDDLSTYLAIFLFFSFIVFITANYKKSKDNYRFYSTKNILSALLAFSIIPSLYYFNFLPYQKNKKIIISSAYSRTRRKDLALEFWDKSLKYKSPIGQGEDVKYFLFFASHLLRDIELKGYNSSRFNKVVEDLAYYSDKVYRKNKKFLIGSQPLVALSELELSAYDITKDKDILDMAEERITEGRKISPTRISFLELERKIAEIKGDKKKEEQDLKEIKFLRPDLINTNKNPKSQIPNNN